MLRNVAIVVCAALLVFRLERGSISAAPPPVDPKPENAIDAILSAFGEHDIVALDAGHRSKDEDDLILSLLRRRNFPSVVNDIVVECGNARYQSLLDRYIDGEAVTLTDARQVWRNTTQNMCATSEFYDALFPLVRALNLGLPETRRLRILAGDSPIDWSAAKGPGDAAPVVQALLGRDVSAASVIESEVLAKHRKALMLYGTAHALHGLDNNAVGLVERHHPGVTFVIYTHASFGCDVPSVKDNDEIESRMASWSIPAVARIHDTWLADVPAPPAGRGSRSLGGVADAYLYLGPRDLMLAESRPALTFLDGPFMAELARRTAIGVGSFTDIIDPEDVRRVDSEHLMCALGTHGR